MIKGWAWVSGGASATFKTIQTPSGTSPVATGPNDILTLSAGSNITITGDATTDTVTISATGGAPGGTNTNVQYNDSGVFGGDANYTWDKTAKLLTITNAGLGATTTAISERLVNTTAATVTVKAQVSPATQWRGNGWRTTAGGSSRTLDFNAYTVPYISGTSEVWGEWRLDYSKNGATAARGLQYQTDILDGVGRGLFKVNGFQEIVVDNSSTIDTLQNLDIVNSTGNQTHFTFTFGSTIRYGISNTTNGSADYRTAGSAPIHSFYVGSTITSQTLIAQIYGSGFYNSYNNYNAGVVTAGSTDQSVQTTLSTYGSFASKGVYVNSASYTLAQTEMMVYCDPSFASFCTGTPTACSTYVSEGTCNAHTGVGCTWFAGNACSIYNGDAGGCTGQPGCTWDTSSCSAADNTDQTTCEAQDDAYGGSCAWDTTTCPAFTTIATCNAQSGCTASTSPCSTFDGQSQGTCEANTGCSWTGASCNAFDGTDQATCETGHTGCTWDGGTNTCNGVYDEGSTCSGDYLQSCDGNLCTGTYNNGNCSGTYGAECQGTASCSNLTDDGSTACNAESGCSWQVGINLTLPTSANALRGTTGRIYSIVHVGDTGTCSIGVQSGENIFQYGTSLTLFKKGDKVLLHNQNITFPCSNFSSQTPCNAQSPCVWQPVITCSSYDGNESGCTANPVSNYCAWNSGDNTCTGAGNATAFCGPSGTTYSSTNRWYAHSMERGLNYVEKTSAYTITDIDDVVNCTSGTFNLTLPSAALNNGKQYTLKNTGSGVITLVTTSSQTIDGNASATLTLNTGDSMTVMSNNSNWVII